MEKEFKCPVCGGEEFIYYYYSDGQWEPEEDEIGFTWFPLSMVSELVLAVDRTRISFDLCLECETAFT